MDHPGLANATYVGFICRTCHGNAPRATENDSGDGGVRIAFAICYAPVARRTAEVHKEALLKGHRDGLNIIQIKTTLVIGYDDYHLMTLSFACFISFQLEKREIDII